MASVKMVGGKNIFDEPCEDKWARRFIVKTSVRLVATIDARCDDSC